MISIEGTCNRETTLAIRRAVAFRVSRRLLAAGGTVAGATATTREHALAQKSKDAGRDLLRNERACRRRVELVGRKTINAAAGCRRERSRAQNSKVQLSRRASITRGPLRRGCARGVRRGESSREFARSSRDRRFERGSRLKSTPERTPARESARLRAPERRGRGGRRWRGLSPARRFGRDRARRARVSTRRDVLEASSDFWKCHR